MRDLLLTLIVLGSIPLILKRPYVGVLVWSWLSYMNPHRMTWGFAYDMPFAQIIAITLLVSLLLDKEKKKIPVDGLFKTWIIFVIWMSMTTLFALSPDAAFSYYERVLKIQVLTFITIMCMTSHRRIDMLIWTICLSIGFFAVKGGVFTVITAGNFRVYGPPDSFINENNALGLATLMVIPLMYYLYTVTSRVWVKWGLIGAIALSMMSVLGSQSRGAFLAILSLAGYAWLLSRVKFLSGFLIVMLVAIGFNFMPQSWHDRMSSIKNYEDDPSAMSRIAAWNYAISLANQRLVGGGFKSYSRKHYSKYYKDVNKAYVSHSIYFSVLAAHGWPGLFLFLSILVMTLRNLSQISKRTRGDPSLKKYNVLSRMLTLSLIAYMSGGAFLSLAYFDLPWHIIAIAYLIKHQILDKRDAEVPAELIPNERKAYHV